jgi:hypothetical protein
LLLFDLASDPTLLGIAAIVAALGGILSTILGNRRARREEHEKSEEECRTRLREARAEAEELAQALHKIRMTEFRASPEHTKEVEDILERWSHLE